MSDPAKSASSVLSITSIVLSMAGVGIGNGMMFAYVPFMLAKSGSSPEVAGAAVTALAFGGLAGCVVAGPMIRRVGHARAFSCSMALVILSAVLISLGVSPLALGSGPGHLWHGRQYQFHHHAELAQSRRCQ